MPATAAAPATTSAGFISPAALLKHWQGHRRLTRRMIEAFPDDKLFTFTVGGMRPFGELASEALSRLGALDAATRAALERFDSEPDLSSGD